MIHGIGVDILHCDRVHHRADAWEDPFIKKTYTQREMAEGNNSTNPRRWFAERFAAKEAVFKALGISCERIRWSDIEVLSDAVGKPVVTLYGAILEELRRINGSIHLSISEDKGITIAFAVCEINPY